MNPGWENSDPLFSEEEVDRLLREYVEWDEKEVEKLKCECGSDACGSPKHSDWCPKCKKS